MALAEKIRDALTTQPTTTAGRRAVADQRLADTQVAAARNRGAALDQAADRLNLDLHGDPRLAPAERLLAAFRGRSARLARERERVALERASRERTGNGTQRDDMLRTRLAELRQDEPIVAAVDPPTDAPTAAISAGLKVLAGEPAPKPRDYAAQIAEIDRQLEILREAELDQAAVVAEIADTVTVELLNRVAPEWAKLQLSAYRAAQELARATGRVRDLRATILNAGIELRPDILPQPAVRAPLMLGDEAEYDSEISNWRRILERLGMLK